MNVALTPGRWEGVHVAFVTDMHAGKKYNGEPVTIDQHKAVGVDIDWLSTFCDVVAMGGDNVDWATATPEDNLIKSWISSRTGPVVCTSGNHDLANSTSYAHRTGAAWAAATGVPKSNYAPVSANNTGLQVITTTQESMRFNEWLTPAAAAADPRPEVKPGRGFVLSDNPNNPLDTSTGYGYLRSRLETGRPTWILQHYAMSEHIPSRYVPPETDAKFQQLVAQYPNIIGVLSGHRHALIDVDKRIAKSYKVGNRTLAGVNSPPCGGQNTPFEIPFLATVVTYRPGSVTVRWRDVLRRAWVPSVYGYSTTFSVSCNLPARPYVK